MTFDQITALLLVGTVVIVWRPFWRWWRRVELEEFAARCEREIEDSKEASRRKARWKHDELIKRDWDAAIMEDEGRKLGWRVVDGEFVRSSS